MKKLLETRIPTSEALTLLDIKIHQLFGLMKEKHLQGYDNLGRKVVDVDSYPKTKKHSLEWLMRIARGAEFGPGSRPPTNYEQEEFERKVHEEFNNQPDIPLVPEDCVGFDFNPSKKKSYLCFSLQIL